MHNLGRWTQMQDQASEITRQSSIKVSKVAIFTWRKRSTRSELSKIGNDIRAPDYALAAPCEGGSKASSGRDWRLAVELHEAAQTTPTLPQGRSKEQSITQAGTDRRPFPKQDQKEVQNQSRRLGRKILPLAYWLIHVVAPVVCSQVENQFSLLRSVLPSRRREKSTTQAGA